MPRQKPITVRPNETFYVDGRAMKVTHCKRGGFQVWVPAYCEISLTAVEVVRPAIDEQESKAV